MNATISIADMPYFYELVPICILNNSGVTFSGFNQAGELNPSANESFLRLLYMFSLQNILLLGQQKVAAPGLLDDDSFRTTASRKVRSKKIALYIM